MKYVDSQLELVLTFLNSYDNGEKSMQNMFRIWLP